MRGLIEERGEGGESDEAMRELGLTELWNAGGNTRNEDTQVPLPPQKSGCLQ